MEKSLLMIHGVGCGGDVWGAMRPAFEAAGYACHAPTLFAERRKKRNPPDSLARLGLGDYVEASASLARDLTERHGRKPVVIGHSMGGLIAQKLAERGLVEAGIFLTPAAPKGSTITDLRVLRTFWSVVRVGPKKLRGRVARIGPKGFAWGVLNRVDKARHAEIYGQALFDSGRVWADLADPPAVNEEALRVPTLTIGAGRDRATPIAGVRKVARKYARAPVPGDSLEYPENGHWIVDEPGSDEVTADIITWLRRKTPE